MDGYFTALDTDSTAAADDRTALLEGVAEELQQGANDAMDAIDYLCWSGMALIGTGPDQAKQDVANIFREFSDADLGAADGLQYLINQLDKTWKALQDNSKSQLDQAEKLLGVWRGEAANGAKAAISQLAATFTRVESKITVLESDVVAAREAIASARQDLANLGSTFKASAAQFVQENAQQNDGWLTKVLVEGFAGAVTGLLVVVSDGVGAAEGGAVFTMARGALVAGHAAGQAITASVENAATISGDSAKDLYQSFLDNVDKIRQGMSAGSDDLAANIGVEARDLPTVPPPPDVSPGGHFDPGNFETADTSPQTEKRVRAADVDITPEGNYAAPPGNPG